MEKEKQSSKAFAKQTAVYVTGLPEDTTIDELHEHFSKVGVIMDDMFTGGPRIKLYEDDGGALKGDALVVYLCEPSVKLAVDILDESQLRPGRVIQVKPASFKQNEENTHKETHPEKEGQEKKVDKKTWKKQMRHMKRKLEWKENDTSSAEDSDEAEERARMEKYYRIVVLKHMFTKQEIEEDPKTILDIKEDILLEAEKFGPVTSVYLLDQSEDGKCVVRFRSRDPAAACIRAFNGRFFGGNQIIAEVYDGSFKIRESKVDQSEDRLEKFAEWLENSDEDDEKDEPNHSH